MIEIKPKYKTKQYYKKCVTQKTLENKTYNIKHKTLLRRGFISQLGQGAIPVQQSQTWRYCPKFPCFFWKEARKNIHGTVLIYEKSQ